jgi:hypothetical protein
LLLIFILINFVSAIELGISPGKVEFSGECENITIFANGRIIAEDKWSKTESRNLEDYNLNARDVGVEINYEKNFIVDGKRKIQICVKAEGRHYGIFLVRQEGSIAGVGSWLTLDINKKEQQNKNIFLLFIPTTLELVILLFLLRKL